MDALERAQHMFFHVKMSELPQGAIAYAKHLSNKYGMCSEVVLTAYAHFAEIVEGLDPSDDKAYRADPIAREFFENWEEPVEPTNRWKQLRS